MIKRAMDSPEFRMAQKIDERISMMKALGILAYTTCDYLELQFGCKRNGMMNYLKFLGMRIKELYNDQEYFELAKERYESLYKLDVPKTLDLDSFCDPQYIEKIFKEANL